MDIHFSAITPDNWRIFNALKVKKEQEKFVTSNVTILGLEWDLSILVK